MMFQTPKQWIVSWRNAIYFAGYLAQDFIGVGRFPRGGYFAARTDLNYCIVVVGSDILRRTEQLWRGAAN